MGKKQKKFSAFASFVGIPVGTASSALGLKIVQ